MLFIALLNDLLLLFAIWHLELVRGSDVTLTHINGFFVADVLMRATQQASTGELVQSFIDNRRAVPR